MNSIDIRNDSLSIDDTIIERILLIRGHRVMLDADLSEMYGVTTKRLNEQVKRNPHRFPDDFMIQLSNGERDELVANCDRLRKLKHSSRPPFAFTEYGALMLANVLHSTQAINVSIHIVRAFARMRSSMLAHQELSKRIDELERTYDSRFRTVFEALRQLMAQPSNSRQQIGFAIPKDRSKNG